MNETLFEFFFFGTQVIVTPWKILGLVGVTLFTGRWLVQMYYSRKAGKPVTPRVFWILSMIGSVMVLAYFLFSPKRDMVGIVGNMFPCVIAAYNLYLDVSHTRRVEAEARSAPAQTPAAAIPAPVLAAAPEPELEPASLP